LPFVLAELHIILYLNKFAGLACYNFDVDEEFLMFLVKMWPRKYR